MKWQMGVGSVLGGLALLAACNGRTNLGDNAKDEPEKQDDDTESMAGMSSGASGGTAGAKHTGGQGGKGDIGGTTGTAGSETFPNGGDAGARNAGGQGGKGGTGGTTGTAGSEAFPNGGDAGAPTAPTPYPLEPTLPIPADCSCASEDEVCNAASECVPRCSDDGVCAVWRVGHRWTSVITSGEDIYYTEQGSLDVLGNPLPGDDGKEGLWKAHYPDAAPTRIAALDGQYNAILARIHDKTYIQKYPKVLVVSDDGTSTERALPEGAYLVQVAETGVYFMRSDSAVARIPLDEDGGVTGEPEELLPPPTRTVRNLLISDRLWVQVEEELCGYDLADLAAAPTCDGVLGFVISVGQSEVFIKQWPMSGISQWDAAHDTWRVLYDGNDSSFSPTVAGDFIYAWSFDQFAMPTKSMLFRVPTVGPAELPTALISEAVANAYMVGEHAFGSGIFAPQVTSEGVYWQQSTDDALSRYIFRLPLD